MPQVLKLGSKNLNSENWKVYHPNGHHMFTCGERKAMWYLEKTNDNNEPLAIKIGKNKIKLTFEPKGYGYKKDDIFGLAGREIKCVVTGEKECLQRHHIVPYCYRTHFPIEYKSKNHHDVVLVTYKIHEEYEKEATKFKDELAREYGVKTLNELNLEYTKLLCEFSDSKVKSISKLYALFGSYGRIPNEVIVDNLKYVSEHTNFPFKKLYNMNYIQLYKLYLYLKEKHEKELNYLKEEKLTQYDHGYHLVSKLDSHEKIKEFVIRWRKHFIETMKPKYMPKGWSINFRCKVEI